MLRTNGVLGFRYSKQLCLCVIELHMGVNIQRHADVRMTHDILQCLWIHSGFRHIGTEGVSAYMRRNVWHLHPVNVIVSADHIIESMLPMHRNKWHSIIIVKQESAISIYGLLHFWCISVLNDYDRNLRPSRRRGYLSNGRYAWRWFY